MALPVLAVLGGLYLTSFYNYLLFHSLVELFCVIIAFGVFMIAWNSRDLIENNYLLLIGIAYFFVGSLDLVHTLTYKGMNIFTITGANTTTQLWIAGRYMESIALLCAPALLGRRINPGTTFIVSFVFTAGVLVSIFVFDIFPVTFVEGTGLTDFKVMSEYIIITMLIAAVFALVRVQEAFDKTVLRLIIASIICGVCAEIAFTFYVDVYDFSNLLGHYFKLISYYLLYAAMIKTGLQKPYSIMLRDLKESEERLLHEKNLAETYLAIAGVIFVIIDTSGKVALVNERGCRILGCNREDVHGTDWFDTFVPTHSREEERSFLRGFLSGKEESVAYRESFVMTKEGAERVIAWHHTLLRGASKKVTGMLSSGEDITGRLEYEKALKKYQGQLEQLVQERTDELEKTNSQLVAVTRKLAEAESAERKRISRELHDLIGQNLTALGLNLNIIQTKLSKKELETVQGRINDSLMLVEETTVCIRDVMAQLRPPVLDDYGLFAATRWYGEQFKERTGVDVKVLGSDLPVRPAMHTETALFRIIQETLGNVVKHSGATLVSIALKQQDGSVLLTIEDNGVGFDSSEVARSQMTGKWGLINIRERAMSIGGSCRIESVPGQGTRIVVEVLQ